MPLARAPSGAGDELARLIRGLGLSPHPEGGWYREIHRSPGRLELERGPRAALTVIDYALARGDFSSFHRVSSEEVWTWCAGAPLELFLLAARPDSERIELGPDLEGGQRRTAVVPAGTWQAARPLAPIDQPGPGYTWCSCVVAPGFDFADFELAARAALAAEFPADSALIEQLTRQGAG